MCKSRTSAARLVYGVLFLIFIYFKLKRIHFIWKSDSKGKLFCWFTSQFPERLGLGWAEAKSPELRPGLPYEWPGTEHWAIACCLLHAWAGSRSGSAVARTWTCVPVWNCTACRMRLASAICFFRWQFRWSSNFFRWSLEGFHLVVDAFELLPLRSQ